MCPLEGVVSNKVRARGKLSPKHYFLSSFVFRLSSIIYINLHV
jgi:hypothetical protein